MLKDLKETKKNAYMIVHDYNATCFVSRLKGSFNQYINRSFSKLYPMNYLLKWHRVHRISISIGCHSN